MHRLLVQFRSHALDTATWVSCVSNGEATHCNCTIFGLHLLYVTHLCNSHPLHSVPACLSVPIAVWTCLFVIARFITCCYISCLFYSPLQLDIRCEQTAVAQLLVNPPSRHQSWHLRTFHACPQVLWAHTNNNAFLHSKVPKRITPYQ